MVDKRKKRRMEKINDSKAEDQRNLPMNKDYLNSLDSSGEPKFEMAARIKSYLVNNSEDVNDQLVNLSAHLNNIGHLTVEYADLKMQYEGEVNRKNSVGEKISKSELFVLMMTNRINRQKAVSAIRTIACHKLLPMISEFGWTAERYDDFMKSLEKALKKYGYELLPSDVEVIPFE